MAASCIRVHDGALHRDMLHLALWAAVQVQAEQHRRNRGPDQNFGLLGCQAADHDSPGVVCASGQGLLQLLCLHPAWNQSQLTRCPAQQLACDEPEAA